MGNTDYDLAIRCNDSIVITADILGSKPSWNVNADDRVGGRISVNVDRMYSSVAQFVMSISRI